MGHSWHKWQPVVLVVDALGDHRAGCVDGAADVHSDTHVVDHWVVRWRLLQPPPNHEEGETQHDAQMYERVERGNVDGSHHHYGLGKLLGQEVRSEGDDEAVLLVFNTPTVCLPFFIRGASEVIRVARR